MSTKTSTFRKIIREEINRAEKERLVNIAKVVRAIVREEIESVSGVLAESKSNAVEYALSQSKPHSKSTKYPTSAKNLNYQPMITERKISPPVQQKSVRVIEAEVAGGIIDSALDSGVDLSKFGI